MLPNIRLVEAKESVRRRAWVRALAALLSGLAICTLAGCATADKFRLAEPGAPPAKVLDIDSATAPLDVTLKSVIVTGGAGSWKLRALWDEYVVRLANRSDKEINLRSVQLFDAGGMACTPYDDPWKLEELRYSAWDQYGRSTLRAAGWTLEGTALVLTALVEGSSGIKPGPPNGLGKVAIAVGVLGLIDLVVVAVADSDNKEQVETEFRRRRLALPGRIAPHESIEASLFFPVTARPERLVLKADSDAQPLEVTLDLGAIAISRPAPDR